MPEIPCTITIAPEDPEDAFESVYCSAGGSLESAGFVLYSYYADPYKTRALIREGNMSRLAPSIRDCAFDAAKSGESPRITRARMYNMLCGSIKINYLFGGGSWQVCGEQAGNPKPLELALAEDYKANGPVKAMLEDFAAKNPEAAEAIIAGFKAALKPSKKG